MLNIKSRNLLTYLLWLAFLLFTFNINGAFVGLPEMITTARLGIILLGFTFFIVLFTHSLPAQRHLNTPFKIITITLFFIILEAIASALTCVKGIRLISMTYITSWILITIVFIISFIIMQYIDIKLFVRLWIITGIALFGLILILIYNKVGMSAERTFVYRSMLNESLPGGLNRFFNGLFLFALAPISIIMRFYKGSFLFWLIGLVTFLALIFLSIFSGSRQFIGGVIFLILLLILAKFALAESPRAAVLSFIKMLSLLVVGFLFLLTTVDSFTDNVFIKLINSRLIEKTELQMEGADERFDRYREQLKLSFRHPVFGIGPGGFFQKTGEYPDSGFLGIAVDYGYFPALFLVFNVSIVFLWALKNWKCIAKQNPKKDTQIYAICVLGGIIVFYWFNIWNELLKEYFFWMMLGLIITQKQRLENIKNNSSSEVIL
jgi:hypothetical protein